MVASYFINFTDPESLPFQVNAFTSNGPSSPTSTVLNSSAITESTSLLIYGKGHPEYGERIQEHLVNIMENFSGASEPQNPISGQAWFDRITYVRTGSPATFYRWIDDAGSPADPNEGTWNTLPSVTVFGSPAVDTVLISEITPNPIINGAFWYRPSTDSLRLGVSSTTSNANEWLPRVYENLTNLGGSPPNGIAGAPDPAVYRPQKQLKVYDGLKWKNTSNVFASPVPPQDPADGDLWYNTYGSPQANELLISQNGDWQSIGSGAVVAGSPTGVVAGSSQFEVGTYGGSPVGVYTAATVDATDPGVGTETGVLVFVNGVQQAQGVDFTYNYALDQITFTLGSPTSEPSPGDQIVLMTVGISGTAGGGSPTILQNLWETMSSDSGSVAANIATDTFTIAGGTGISTAIAGDTLTITNDDPNVDQNIWLNIVADAGGTAVANTTTDTLTIAGGTNVTTTRSGDTITIDATASGGGSPSGFIGVRHESADGSQTPTGFYQPITWGTTPAYEFGSPQWFDEATNDERFIVPKDGKYMINGNVLWNTAGNSDGDYIAIGLSVNGARIAEEAQLFDTGEFGLSAVGFSSTITTGPVELLAGDFIELEVATDDTGGPTISASNRTNISIWKVN